MAEEGDDKRQSAVLDPPMEIFDGGDDLISNLLQCQLKSLQTRVKELEMENAALLSQISNCRCQTLDENSGGFVVSSNSSEIEESRRLIRGSCEEEEVSKNEELQGGGIKSTNQIKKKTRKKSSSGCNLRSIHHHAKRHIALKVMYFGKRFYGFASEAQMDPTVESEIFKALKQTRLLVVDKESSRYSRCGRTDKGVSSIGQVIALFLRSNLKDKGLHANYESPKELSEEEIDYVRVLNRVLPNDIRVLGWCPAPTDVHARFSCLSREYKYLFWRDNLDISAMEKAGKKFVGEHDFRNFCKMDAVNVHNYRRHITSFEISTCDERSEDSQLWAMTIKGSAFLWHQVRCMVAVLFMIGQGLESPSVIDALLDTNKIPRKPQYTMAPELPLILQSCEFEGLNFICSPDAEQGLKEHLRNEFKTYKLQSAIFLEALMSCSSTTDGSLLNHDKKKVAHIPLMSRPTEREADSKNQNIGAAE
ncbi:Pseudouridine synthase I [Macleaya cordata]|uniref:Pseudouridine synthase I n=1 Tax=Macleaya cordata TaxID=56857 RepID=A0A200QCG4_MACCD|nr:Pseudouridine synthase I [Macleaya cordata]